MTGLDLGTALALVEAQGGDRRLLAPLLAAASEGIGQAAMKRDV